MFTKLIQRIIRLKRIFIYLSVPIYFKLYGIKIGKNFKMSSYPILFKIEGAKINIGNYFSVNNYQYENLAGATNKTIITASRVDAIINIGNYVGMSSVVINAKVSVTIEDYVQIGINTKIYDNDFHDIDPIQRKYEVTRSDKYNKNIKCKPVTIKENVWIGANCIILKGVTIGENSVIGTGSIVTKSIPSNVIAAGNPARIIRNIGGTENY
jgi:acetyltransferase-like isoleucine patch superfamily enzyme